MLSSGKKNVKIFKNGVCKSSRNAVVAHAIKYLLTFRIQQRKLRQKRCKADEKLNIFEILNRSNGSQLFIVCGPLLKTLTTRGHTAQEKIICLHVHADRPDKVG